MARDTFTWKHNCKGNISGESRSPLRRVHSSTGRSFDYLVTICGPQINKTTNREFVEQSRMSFVHLASILDE